MNLEQQLCKKKEQRPILLMTHIVLGYPSFEVNRQVIAEMVKAGVDCIELQIPFSEPMADGPVILKANQTSLARGTTVGECLAFAKEVTAAYDLPFLFMTYYNIIFKYGEKSFIDACHNADIKGLIVPDLPPEMARDYLHFAKTRDIAPVQIFSPTSTRQRMAELDAAAEGFIYCVARKGVTGKKSELDKSFTNYLKLCREMTRLPLAVGFGIQSKEDIDSLRGKADMAVIGSKMIKLVDGRGSGAVAPFIKGLGV